MSLHSHQTPHSREKGGLSNSHSYFFLFHSIFTLKKLYICDALYDISRQTQDTMRLSLTTLTLTSTFLTSLLCVSDSFLPPTPLPFLARSATTLRRPRAANPPLRPSLRAKGGDDAEDEDAEDDEVRGGPFPGMLKLPLPPPSPHGTTNSRTRTHTHTRAHTCTHAHIHTYTHTHIHT